MSLSCSMSCSQSQTLSQRQTLSLEQRHALLQGHSLSLRCQLIQALRGEKYEPRGVCPKCERRLTPAEILAGFNQDPNDFTTRCTSCGCRFEPKLISGNSFSTIELPFFCSAQTLARMTGLETLEPEEIAHREPAIYRAAIFHHGTLKGAFAATHIEYAREKPLDWQNKIAPFLGRLPDTIIAECSGITIRKVRTMRRKLNVPAYSLSRALEEIEESEED